MFDLLYAYPELTDSIGIAGFFFYIISFCAVQTGKICGNGMIYVLANVAAATLVLISLINAFNIASFLIQISFISIGIYGVARKLQARRKGQNWSGTGQALKS